jgi:putative transcriptional regulator
MQSTNLTGHFLIAMPNMVDRNFAGTVTFVCEHNEQGALGVVINRPTGMTLKSLYEQIDVPLEPPHLRDVPVHYGGPVQVDRGFVLHRPLGQWQSTLAVTEEIGLTTSKDVLVAIGRGEGPQSTLVTVGYAGWAPGQLENEIKLNAWLTVPATSAVIFDRPVEERVSAAFGLLGIDASMLSDTAGHA